MSFVSVRTATLRAETELLFDVYVHFKDSHLKFRKTAERLDPHTIERLKAKKIKKVYILEEQESKYLEYLDLALEQLQKENLTVNDRAGLAQDTLKQESDNIEKTLETEEAYRSSESRIQKVVEFMLKEPKALAGMLSSAGLSVDTSAHASTVSSLALAVGTGSKFVGREELTDLAVAGLLHDTSLKTLGFSAEANLESIAKEQKNDFKRHPAVTVEQVAGKKFITPRVLRLIEDHEEYGDGQGFPGKKRYSRLQIDSQIFNLCDAFDHFSIQLQKSPVDCIESFIEAKGMHFDLQLIEILEKQIKA